MLFLCRLGLHRAAPSKLWNDGHYFSNCKTCRAPMIRTAEGKWQSVPPGMQVVWRPRTGDDIVWPNHIL